MRTKGTACEMHFRCNNPPKDVRDAQRVRLLRWNILGFTLPYRIMASERYYRMTLGYERCVSPPLARSYQTRWLQISWPVSRPTGAGYKGRNCRASEDGARSPDCWSTESDCHVPSRRSVEVSEVINCASETLNFQSRWSERKGIVGVNGKWSIR